MIAVDTDDWSRTEGAAHPFGEFFADVSTPPPPEPGRSIYAVEPHHSTLEELYLDLVGDREGNR